VCVCVCVRVKALSFHGQGAVVSRTRPCSFTDKALSSQSAGQRPFIRDEITKRNQQLHTPRISRLGGRLWNYLQSRVSVREHYRSGRARSLVVSGARELVLTVNSHRPAWSGKLRLTKP